MISSLYETAVAQVVHD